MYSTSFLLELRGVLCILKSAPGGASDMLHSHKKTRIVNWLIALFVGLMIS